MSGVSTRGNVRYRGLSELRLFNSQLPTILNTVALNTFKKYGKIIFDDTQGKVPVRTGRLKRSGGWSVGNTFLSLFYNEHYAYYVDVGTGRFSGRHYFYRVVQSYEQKITSDINQQTGVEFKKYLKP